MSNYLRTERNMSDYKQIYEDNSKQICLNLNRFKQKMKQLFTKILRHEEIRIERISFVKKKKS